MPHAIPHHSLHKKRENPRGKDEFRRARNATQPATPPSTDGDRWRAQPISLNVTGRQAVFLGLSALGEARRDCCLSSERPVSPDHSSPPSRYTALFLNYQTRTYKRERDLTYGADRRVSPDHCFISPRWQHCRYRRTVGLCFPLPRPAGHGMYLCIGRSTTSWLWRTARSIWCV